MTESSIELREHIKRLAAGKDKEGRPLPPDRRVAYAVDIAQNKFLANHNDVEGATLIRDALNWPSEHSWTAIKGCPNVSDKTWLVALATYELLATVSPYDKFSLPSYRKLMAFTGNISRLADQIESRSNADLADLKDVFFARMANAIVFLINTRNAQAKNGAIKKLQQTSRSFEETMKTPSKHPEQMEHEAERSVELIHAFNQTQWHQRAIQEGEGVHIIDTLFRYYQGAPI